MKIIARVTLIGRNRETLPPGAEIDLPKEEAQSLISRGFADLPDDGKNKRKGNSVDSVDGNQNTTDTDDDGAGSGSTQDDPIT